MVHIQPYNDKFLLYKYTERGEDVIVCETLDEIRRAWEVLEGRKTPKTRKKVIHRETYDTKH